GYRLDTNAWRAIVAQRYGEHPEARIRDLYEELAVTSKELGAARLQPLEVQHGDVVGVLGAPRALPEDPGRGAGDGSPRDADDDREPGSGELPPDPVMTT